MEEPRSIRTLREALLKLGLSDDEVQRFLAILRSDLPDSIPDEESVRNICEEFASTLSDDDRFSSTPLLSWRMAKIVSGGLALGVLGNLLYDLLKSEWAESQFSDSSSERQLVFPGGWSPIGKVPDGHPSEAHDPKLPRVITGLTSIRKRFGLSVERMAAECRVSRQTYLKAERGDPLSRTVADRMREAIHRLAQERGLEFSSSERGGPLPPGKTWP